MNARRALMVAIGAVVPMALTAQEPRRATPAELAALRSDLRNLVTAEEAYFADHVTYTKIRDSLPLQTSPGVTITIDQATGTGWRATARMAGTSSQCTIFVGSASSQQPGAREGEPLCDGVRSAELPQEPADFAAGFAPQLGAMMSGMYEQLTQALARPETAERLATFARNYFEALMRRGFTRAEALQLTAAVGLPGIR